MFYYIASLLVVLVELALCQETYKLKYEYKYSFKGPNLSQSDKTVPFWTHSFDAVPGADQIRVVPSLRGQHGAVWSKFPFPYDAWQVEVSFRIHGRGKVGADGLVIWYAETPNHDGPVFGSKDQWKGMGLFFDSFDNDGKRNNPYISVIMNDGTKTYSHATDGLEQMNGGCLRDFRNRPYPVKARIRYSNDVLQVYIDSGNTNTEDYELCAEVNNVKLPKDYFFGITAATGGLADDHDVLKFLTWSLQDKSSEEEEGTEDEQQRLQEEERKRLQDEYEQSLQEFYSDQEKFKEQHPDKVKEEPVRPDDLFQGGSSDELQAVFDVQSKIKQQISALTSSMIMVLEKQDRIVSKLDEKSPTDVQLAKSHEVENVVKIQRTTYDAVVELQNHLNFLKSTAQTLADNVARLNTAGGGRGDAGIASKQYEANKSILDMREKLQIMHDDITSMENRQKQQPKLSCPEPEMPSCVPLVGLIVIAIIQVVILLAYHSVKQSREDAAKKFF